MKFGAKKSHEMISYNLAWIALLSEWEYGMSTKPRDLAQTSPILLMNKSHEGFVLSNVKKMLLSVGIAKIVLFIIWF